MWIPVVFWNAGSTVSFIAEFIETKNCVLRCLFSSFSFLVTWLVISEIVILAVSMVISVFSLLFVFNNDQKSTLFWTISWLGLTDSMCSPLLWPSWWLANHSDEKPPNITFIFSVSGMVSDCLERLSLAFYFLDESIEEMNIQQYYFLVLYQSVSQDLCRCIRESK